MTSLAQRPLIVKTGVRFTVSVRCVSLRFTFESNDRSLLKCLEASELDEGCVFLTVFIPAGSWQTFQNSSTSSKSNLCSTSELILKNLLSRIAAS